jgi:hypothetical protein
MHYDLVLIAELCTDLGFAHESVLGKSVTVALALGTKLRFENYANEQDASDDCVVGFEGTPSHSHGDLDFYARGQQLELNALEVLWGIADGTVLICERWTQGKLADRWLVHKDFVDEFQHLDPGEEIRIRRYLVNDLRGEDMRLPAFAAELPAGLDLEKL